MVIGEKEYDNITITDCNGGVISVITDDEIIECDGYHVRFDVGIERKAEKL